MLTINDLQTLEQLKGDVAAVIKSVKDLDRKSNKLRELGMDCTEKQRSKAAGAANMAALERNRCVESLKSTLTELGLIEGFEAGGMVLDNGGMSARLR